MILLKALVPAHTRHDADGRAVPVRAYVTRAPGAAPSSMHVLHTASAVTPPVVSYSSGASAPGILRGYIVAGSPVGVSLSEFGPDTATWDMVIGYAQRGGQVFVDTGAFPAFTRGQPVDWDRNVALMSRLAHEASGARLHMVMPDVIGDQAASLDLLTERRGYVRQVIASGHDALVAIQKGPLSPFEAWREAVHILGTDDFTVCVPSNKAAFSHEDLAELMSGHQKPARVHFLGVAGNKRKLAELAAVVHRANPACVVTSDANRLRAKVGQGRPLTEGKKRAHGWLRDAFLHLLQDDPEMQAQFAAQAGRVLGAASTTMAIHGDEAMNRTQPDLFGGVPMRKGLVLFMKAAIVGGAAGDLFAVPVPVKGHTTRAGVTVAPHTALRRKHLASAVSSPLAVPAPTSDLFAAPAPAPAPAPAVDAPVTVEGIAGVLQTSPKNLPSRVFGMKLGDTCGRCLGSGRYSYNLSDGDRCFGCGGTGQKFPRDLPELGRRAAEAVDSGALTQHLDKLRAMAAIKNARERTAAAVKQVEELNGYGELHGNPGHPAYAEARRLYEIVRAADDRVSLAFTGLDYKALAYGGKRQPTPGPAEQERILNGALADIEGVRQHLQSRLAAGEAVHPNAVPAEHGLPPGSAFAEGKGPFGRGRWRVAVPDGPITNYDDSKEAAIVTARAALANAAVEAEAKRLSDIRDREIVGKLNSGYGLDHADIVHLGLRPGKMAEFAVLSPLAQRLLGVSRRNVREAMGAALVRKYSDEGSPVDMATPAAALVNVASWMQDRLAA